MSTGSRSRSAPRSLPATGAPMSAATWSTTRCTTVDHIMPQGERLIELASGRQHGPFDSEADVCLCLAFAKLARDQVEIVKDAPITASFTAWE